MIVTAMGGCSGQKVNDLSTFIFIVILLLFFNTLSHCNSSEMSTMSQNTKRCSTTGDTVPLLAPSSIIVRDSRPGWRQATSSLFGGRDATSIVNEITAWPGHVDSSHTAYQIVCHQCSGCFHNAKAQNPTGPCHTSSFQGQNGSRA